MSLLSSLVPQPLCPQGFRSLSFNSLGGQMSRGPPGYHLFTDIKFHTEPQKGTEINALIY